MTRLTTLVYWEYACRAGTTTASAFADGLSSRQANFKGQPYNGADVGPSLNRAAKAGGYPANPWGLNDMHGYVFEWWQDWSQPELPGRTNPDLYEKKGPVPVPPGRLLGRRGLAVPVGLPIKFEPERTSDHIGLRVVVMQH